MKTLVPWLSIRLGLRSKWIPARLLKEVYASMQTSTRPFLEDHTPSGKQENDCEYITYFCVSLCLLLWDSSEISGVSCGHWTHNSKGIWSQWGTGLEGVMCNTSVKFLNSQHLVEVTAGGGWTQEFDFNLSSRGCWRSLTNWEWCWIVHGAIINRYLSCRSPSTGEGSTCCLSATIIHSLRVPGWGGF